MKHSMMRVAVAATLGFAAMAANAGTIGNFAGSTLAAEYLTATTTVAQPTITYFTTSSINDGSTFYVHVRFSGGVLVSTKPATTDVHVLVNGVDTAANYTVNSVTIDTDKAGYYVSITAVAGKGGLVNPTFNFLGTTAVLKTLTSALSNGGTVSATAGFTGTAGDYSGLTAASWVETPASGTILKSAKALSQAVYSSGTADGTVYGSGALSATETKKVDVGAKLTAFDVNSLSTNKTTLNLGYVQFALAPTVVTPANAAPAAADFGTSTLTVTGDFTGTGKTGLVTLSSTANCAGANYTASLSTDKKTATFTTVTAADLVTGLYACYGTDGSVAIPYGVQFAIGGAAVAANGSTTVATTQTGGNAYFLKSNGAAVFVPSFVPTTGAVGTGYNTYLRIINTGNLTADISAAAYDQVAGTVGTASVVAPALKPGASVVVPTANVPVTAAGWSSLLVTGSTSNLAVQPLLVNPQGVITNIGGVNGYTSNQGSATGAN